MRALRLLLLILFFVIFAAFVFWVLVYSSIFSNSSAIYSIRSNYYSSIRKYTKPQVKGEILSGIQVAGVENGSYQYIFAGKYSHFDFDSKVVYLTVRDKVYGFRLPLEVDSVDPKNVSIGFIELDELGTFGVDNNGEPVKRFEPVTSDLWLGKELWIYWNDSRKVEEVLSLSLVNNHILVNDPLVVTGIIRSLSKTK